MKHSLIIGFLSLFLSSCGGGSDDSADNNTTLSSYGLAGSHAPANPYVGQLDTDYVTYYPSDITPNKSTPVIFFAPGGLSTRIDQHTDYSTLLNFIASQGYLVIYTPTIPDGGLSDTQSYIDSFIDSAEEDVTMEPYIDTTRIGMMGWSSGGGNAFNILKGLSDKGWGEQGRFLFLMDPWFAFDMNKTDVSRLPDNTHVIIQKYNAQQDTDPRITQTLYKLLSSIAPSQKDYQIYSDIGHDYPKHGGDYAELQYILKPLDALMAYTFEGDLAAYTTALNVGNDAPYETGAEIPREKETYDFPCYAYGDWTLHITDIDYCEIIE